MIAMWVIYGTLGMLALGTGDFLKKLVLSQGVKKEVFLFMSFVFYIVLLFINFLFQGVWYISQDNLVSASILGITDFFIPLGMLTTLSYLNVSFALVSIRLISSFSVLCIGIFLLGDTLSGYNLLGFFIGAIAIFLLSDISKKVNFDVHLKGITALIITTIAIILSNSYFKYSVSSIQNIHTFMFIKFSISFVCILLYMGMRKKFLYVSILQVKKSFWYAFFGGIIFVIHFLYLYPNIYLNGPLSLSYKMLSYSLIIPIVFSILLLDEKVTKMKLIAFGLTILSIGLFLV